MNAAGPGSSLPALRPQDQSFMPDVAAPLVADPYGARPPLGLRLSDLLITLRLRWKPLLAAFCLPVALGIGGAMLLKPRFTADSVLMVLLNRESTTVQDVSGIGPSVSRWNCCAWCAARPRSWAAATCCAGRCAASASAPCFPS